MPSPMARVTVSWMHSARSSCTPVCLPSARSTAWCCGIRRTLRGNRRRRRGRPARPRPGPAPGWAVRKHRHCFALTDDPARRCEPKRLRLRLFAIGGRIARHARKVHLRLSAHAPWIDLVITALTRLSALKSTNPATETKGINFRGPGPDDHPTASGARFRAPNPRQNTQRDTDQSDTSEACKIEASSPAATAPAWRCLPVARTGGVAPPGRWRLATTRRAGG